MRYIAKAVFLVAALVLLAPNIVFAQDYITDAVQALQRASVYVAPGTEGTDRDTAAKLQGRLNNGDNIVLVMLPSEAEKDLGADPITIAIRLSEKLDNKRIIGLAVGRKVVGYGPTLPSGVAADQMQRADNVSNDSVTALGTFAQDIHRLSPQPTVTPIPKPTPVPTPVSQQNDGVPWFPGLLVPFGVLAVTAFVVKRRMEMAQASKEKTHFRAPDQVKDLLAKIVRERDQISDPELNPMLYQLCVDIEKYFQSSSKDKERDALFFKDRLTDVNKVLTKYLDVQNNLRYYDDPASELRRGKESITDFSQYVLGSIRSGNAADLLDYKVNTKILQAQRYRS